MENELGRSTFAFSISSPSRAAGRSPGRRHGALQSLSHDASTTDPSIERRHRSATPVMPRRPMEHLSGGDDACAAARRGCMRLRLASARGRALTDRAEVTPCTRPCKRRDRDLPGVAGFVGSARRRSEADQDGPGIAGRTRSLPGSPRRPIRLSSAPACCGALGLRFDRGFTRPTRDGSGEPRGGLHQGE
jgi:hypothetical protein